jgi:methylmalonyl-CoA mutase cobalamin-binding subunit
MKALLATIPSDSHTWNLVYMHLFLEELGFEVMNLGACVPIELLHSTSNQFNPDIIVISTINGHGNIEGIEIANKIRSDRKLDKVYLVIGGKLGTIGDQNHIYVDKLINAGFDKVYTGDDVINNFASFMCELNETLKIQLRA